MDKQRKTATEAAAGLTLPPKVSFQRSPLPTGAAYVFRHEELGELGRVCLTGTPAGETSVLVEIAGDESEPMFAKRRAILEPLSGQIIGALESIRGPSEAPQPPLPAPTQEPAGRVPVEEVRCDHCGELVAMLVFAVGATDNGRFEDYARQMYPHYSVTKVPTYIIGPELGAGPGTYRAAIMKVWPEREPIETLSPAKFKSRIDKLVSEHCR